MVDPYGYFWLEYIFDIYSSSLLIQVLIDVETYEYFSVHSKGSEGVLVLVQHYRDIPLMRKESFVLGPGTGKLLIPTRPSPLTVFALKRASESNTTNTLLSPVKRYLISLRGIYYQLM